MKHGAIDEHSEARNIWNINELNWKFRKLYIRTLTFIVNFLNCRSILWSSNLGAWRPEPASWIRWCILSHICHKVLNPVYSLLTNSQLLILETFLHKGLYLFHHSVITKHFGKKTGVLKIFADASNNKRINRPRWINFIELGKKQNLLLSQ